MDQDRDSFIISLLGADDETRLDLGEAPVVELLVRNYADRCLEAFQGLLDERLDEDAATGVIDRHADALNDIFLGLIQPEMVEVQYWNSPEQLGAFICELFDSQEVPSQGVHLLLIRLATAIMKALQRPKEDWSGEVEALVTETRDVLLGRVSAERRRTH